MKRIALALAIALAGCATTMNTTDWQGNTFTYIVGERVTLQSNVWLNKMPMVGEVGVKANAALSLNALTTISSDIEVVQVLFRQGEQEWHLSDDQYEIRPHEENYWEIAASWKGEVDPSQRIDIAVELTDGNGSSEWLVEEQVKVAEVF